MAIKKRTPIDPAARQAAIEAFGEQADHVTSAPESVDEPRTETAPAPVTPRQGRTAPADTTPELRPAWPVDVAKTFLIRYPNPELSTALAELARLEERSQHASAVRALKRGIEILTEEARRQN